jgi:PAS domain-containing protein
MRGVKDAIAIDLTIGAAHRFSQAILDSFAVNIAVLSKDGTILAVNKAWTLFAAENGGQEVRSTEVGIDYLDLAGGKVGPYAQLGQTAYLGIQAVLDGTLPEFSLEYPCPTPTKQRWFLLHVVALLEASNEAAIVSHLDITSLKKAEIKRLDSAEQSRELMDHLQQVFWIKNATKMGVIYVSPAYEKIWGRTC